MKNNDLKNTTQITGYFYTYRNISKRHLDIENKIKHNEILI